jgi:hypothetical protein
MLLPARILQQLQKQKPEKSKFKWTGCLLSMVFRMATPLPDLLS